MRSVYRSRPSGRLTVSCEALSRWVLVGSVERGGSARKRVRKRGRVLGTARGDLCGGTRAVHRTRRGRHGRPRDRVVPRQAHGRTVHDRPPRAQEEHPARAGAGRCAHDGREHHPGHRGEGGMTAAEAVISKRTKGVAGGGAVILVLYSAAAALAPGAFDQVFLSDWGGAILGFAAAAVILRTALYFERGESLRTQWLLICAAVTLWAFGDGMFALIVSSTHASPAVPGPQDVFYVAGYVLIPIALLMIAYSYRRLVDMRWPVFVAGGRTPRSPVR